MSYTEPEFNADYTPRRASARTDRSRLTAEAESIASKLISAQARAEYGDSSFLRLVARYEERLAKARQAIKDFDTRQQSLDAAGDSDDTARAWREAARTAAQFEKTMLAACRAAVELREAGAVLADALQVTDSGQWPSRHAVDTAIRSRCIELLGGAAAVRLEGFGSHGAASVPLDERFKVSK